MSKVKKAKVNTRKTQRNASPQWEYKQVEMELEEASLIDVLNDLGADRWELVQIQESAIVLGNWMNALFKRIVRNGWRYTGTKWEWSNKYGALCVSIVAFDSGPILHIHNRDPQLIAIHKDVYYHPITNGVQVRLRKAVYDALFEGVAFADLGPILAAVRIDEKPGPIASEVSMLVDEDVTLVRDMRS